MNWVEEQWRCLEVCVRLHIKVWINENNVVDILGWPEGAETFPSSSQAEAGYTLGSVASSQAFGGLAPCSNVPWQCSLLLPAHLPTLVRNWGLETAAPHPSGLSPTDWDWATSVVVCTNYGSRCGPFNWTCIGGTFAPAPHVNVAAPNRSERECE